MIKCLNLSANIFLKYSDIHKYYTRNNNNFIAIKCNMNKSEISMYFKSIKIWNKLRADIHNSDSFNILYNG